MAVFAALCSGEAFSGTGVTSGVWALTEHVYRIKNGHHAATARVRKETTPLPLDVLWDPFFDDPEWIIYDYTECRLVPVFRAQVCAHTALLDELT